MKLLEDFVGECDTVAAGDALVSRNAATQHVGVFASEFSLVTCSIYRIDIFLLASFGMPATLCVIVFAASARLDHGVDSSRRR
jgi:hypothetical protein